MKQGGRLEPISSVLDSVTANLRLTRRLAESTLMDLWPEVVGLPFRERSNPLFIDKEDVLVVSVADASTAQELAFMKVQMLKKLQEAASSLGLRLAGLRFELKRFHKC